MDKEELFQARTNPDFLKYLEETRTDAIATKNISALYEVLDSYLILDLGEDKINEIYQNILEISFENVEKIVNENKKLSLEGDDLCYIRAFYEHGIEKYSYENIDGAKQLLFVLSNIIDDSFLTKCLQTHIIALSKNKDLDSFYEEEVDLEASNDDEKYGYFISNFKYDLDTHLEQNKDILQKEYDNLKHLLEG
ncbi:hypothetical protein [Arcobacter arenosus]|jgi:hypothetical protein|uniref:Uncharacterized protein n=1 Tax=Arcobacter arenosus TaxID=2576037 RepID=A0A5R8Y1F1_9BACT|nr:hypothetical protein [Arcobacter arenosus]TLP38616.1 hypothetical protein FDK22_07895 [Arcobacter arenosus]